MEDFNLEPKNTKKLELVLFNDPQVSPQGNPHNKTTSIFRLLVGVGGSAKQSLTRLSAFIQHIDYKQVELAKNTSKSLAD